MIILMNLEHLMLTKELKKIFKNDYYESSTIVCINEIITETLKHFRDEQ